MSGKNVRVTYDRASRTFQLRPGKLLYAFCINSSGQLEHLYWGVDLGEKVSLTYLQRANVKLTFQTAPSEDVLTPAGPIDAVKSTAETMTPSKAWKKYRGAHDVYRRRAENASWRIWGRHRLGKPNTPAGPSPLDKTPVRASSPVPCGAEIEASVRRSCLKCRHPPAQQAFSTRKKMWHHTMPTRGLWRRRKKN